jgi:predicted patatin/cPLA2 family phospholipase
MRALVLSGGGSKGSYQVGALQKWLFDDQIEYDVFCGISVGALNSAFLAQFPYGNQKAAWQSIKNAWDGVNTSTIYKNWWPFGVASSIWKPSVYDSSPLQKWVRSVVDVNKIVKSGKKLHTTAVSWDSGLPFTATEQDPNLILRILASSAFPVMFSHITIDGEQFGDGGMRSETPLATAMSIPGIDAIDAIMCSNPCLFSKFNDSSSAIPDRLERVIDILTGQIELADLEIVGFGNKFAELKPEYKHIKIRLLQPNSILSDPLDFDQSVIQENMKIGYEDAKKLG